jgi:DNA repair protein RadC
MNHEQNYESSRLKLTIPDWAVQDRPREKYLASGFSSLSDTELIAILLRSGTKSESAVDVARNLLSDCRNNLIRLAETPLNKLMKIHGIGKVKAITLQVAFELGKRCRAAAVEEKRKIVNPTDLVELMQIKNAYLDYEEFWVVFVNQGSLFLGLKNFGKGGITSTSVDVRLIVQKALEIKATGIFVCHNHPSGDIEPSKSDLQLTAQIKNASGLMHIQLLDHIIVCKEEYYSFLENGLL